MNYKTLFQNDFSYDGLIGLTPELKSIYAKEYFEKNNNSILIVINSLYEANQFYQSMLNYTKDVLFFPMDDFLTSEALAVSPEFKITRLETLIQLLNNEKKIVITNLMGYLRFLPPLNILKNNIISLKINQEIDMRDFLKNLYQIGYEKEVLVNRTGEIAVRGYVIDIFPVSYPNPIRIEFWGDTIDSIREIDVDTQRTKKNLDSIKIFPNTEFLINQDYELSEIPKQRMIKNFIQPENIGDYMSSPVILFQNYNDLTISYKQLVNEMFQYSLSTNISKDTVYMHDFYDIQQQKKLETKYFMNFDEALSQVSKKKIFNATCVEPFKGTKDEINNRLQKYLKENNQVIIALKNRYEVNKVTSELNNQNFLITNVSEIYPNKINIIILPMQEGFKLDNLLIITSKEIFNETRNQIHYRTNFKLGRKIRDITKLEIGDYIVHSVYGIGQYCGIKTLLKNGLKKDYLMLQYKGKDKLYLPVEKIEFISKYSSQSGTKPKLNNLKGSEWKKTKLRVQKKIESIALDLIKLYAEREAIQGFPFLKDTEEQIQFEKQFEYTETIDQLKVLDEIKKDMEKSRPMDRLLCGDVGFGKTEIAFRAIFKAIMSGKQAALLCPTTILSSQHYSNAKERFESFGCNVALLNRFVSAKEITKIKKDLESGKIDFVIGTHRLLSDDIKFKNLGFLVIDEEQRFGVKHKEKIKQMKTNIDVLTLTATPIPRTLQLSLAGVRNLSLIETPPVNRYPVQTYVMAKNQPLLKDAIYKELSRGGQVFILYNRIDDIEMEACKIKNLVPDAKIVIAHGQMKKDELEDVMIKFINKEYDILICTTIIETGIDIPNVNTLIIEDADRFGLSQLYQIRGRVGRSNKIAYCYLMYDQRKILSEIAQKRLNVIKDFTALGSGFAIAMRDLSIRGAGDILGSEQAGFIDTVGIELFLQMLNEEVERLKGKTFEPKATSENQPLLEISTTISDDYVKDEELKIYIHQKINKISSYETLHETKIELEDRFGKLSEDIVIYMYEEWFEKIAHKLKITNIKQTKNSINIELPQELTEKVNGELLFTLASDITRDFRFGMHHKNLVITLDIVRLKKHFIYYLIELMEILEKAINID